MFQLDSDSIAFCLKSISTVFFKKRSRHLSDMEKTLLEGCLKGLSYEEISEIKNYGKGHCSDTGSRLFKLLSEYYNEPISKRNFIWFCERTYLIKDKMVLQD